MQNITLSDDKYVWMLRSKYNAIIGLMISIVCLAVIFITLYFCIRKPIRSTRTDPELDNASAADTIPDYNSIYKIEDSDSDSTEEVIKRNGFTTIELT